MKNWYKVETTPPPKYERVLAYFPKKSYGSKMMVSYAENEKGGFADSFKWGIATHWQPLPEEPILSKKEKDMLEAMYGN